MVLRVLCVFCGCPTAPVHDILALRRATTVSTGKASVERDEVAEARHDEVEALALLATIATGAPCGTCA